MSVWIFLVAVGLAMDAFAVSVCRGLKAGAFRTGDAIKSSLMFGLFQALMPIAGYFAGIRFARLVESCSHWIAFGILLAIGLNMIRESREKDGPEERRSKPGEFLELLLLSIATSIDALAVGVSLACIGNDIFPASLTIGVVTFVLSIIGVWIGSAFGSGCKSPAEAAGGIILILIGLKIVLERLGVISF